MMPADSTPFVPYGSVTTPVLTGAAHWPASALLPFAGARTVIASSGVAYIAGDSNSWNHAIYAVSPQGEVSVLAGDPIEAGYADGRFAEARFEDPWDLALSPDESTLYVLEKSKREDRLRRIHLTAGNVSALMAGCLRDLDADGISTSANGSALFISCFEAKGDQRRFIKRIDLTETIAENTETISDLKLPGRLRSPCGRRGVAVSPDGRTLFITDGDLVNTCIKKVQLQPNSDDCTCELIAGSMSDRKVFQGISALALSQDGRILYVTDSLDSGNGGNLVLGLVIEDYCIPDHKRPQVITLAGCSDEETRDGVRANAAFGYISSIGVHPNGCTMTLVTYRLCGEDTCGEDTCGEDTCGDDPEEEAPGQWICTLRQVSLVATGGVGRQCWTCGNKYQCPQTCIDPCDADATSELGLCEFCRCMRSIEWEPYTTPSIGRFLAAVEEHAMSPEQCFLVSHLDDPAARAEISPLAFARLMALPLKASYEEPLSSCRGVGRHSIDKRSCCTDLLGLAAQQGLYQTCEWILSMLSQINTSLQWEESSYNFYAVEGEGVLFNQALLDQVSNDTRGFVGFGLFEQMASAFVPALHLSCLAGNADICLLLVQQGFFEVQSGSPSAPTRYFSRQRAHCKGTVVRDVYPLASVSALQLSALKNNSTLCSELIGHKADIEWQDKSLGLSSLHLAALAGATEAMQVLIHHGANINSTVGHSTQARKTEAPYLEVDYGATALHLAAGAAQFVEVELLLDATADINMLALDGGTPLHHSVAAFEALLGNNQPGSGTPKITELGREIPEQELEDIRATWQQHQCARLRVVDLLLERGSKMNIVDASGMSPLGLASLRFFVEAVEKLLKAGAAVSTLDPIIAIQPCRHWLPFEPRIPRPLSDDTIESLASLSAATCTLLQASNPSVFFPALDVLMQPSTPFLELLAHANMPPFCESDGFAIGVAKVLIDHGAQIEFNTVQRARAMNAALGLWLEVQLEGRRAQAEAELLALFEADPEPVKRKKKKRTVKKGSRDPRPEHAATVVKQVPAALDGGSAALPETGVCYEKRTDRANAAIEAAMFEGLDQVDAALECHANAGDERVVRQASTLRKQHKEKQRKTRMRQEKAKKCIDALTLALQDAEPDASLLLHAVERATRLQQSSALDEELKLTLAELIEAANDQLKVVSVSTRIAALEAELARLRGLDDDTWCVICLAERKSVVLLPCRHLCVCPDCAPEPTSTDGVCPMCRTNVVDTIEVFV